MKGDDVKNRLINREKRYIESKALDLVQLYKADKPMAEEVIRLLERNQSIVFKNNATRLLH